MTDANHLAVLSYLDKKRTRPRDLALLQLLAIRGFYAFEIANLRLRYPLQSSWKHIIYLEMPSGFCLLDLAIIRLICINWAYLHVSVPRLPINWLSAHTKVISLIHGVLSVTNTDFQVPHISPVQERYQSSFPSGYEVNLSTHAKRPSGKVAN